VMTAQSVFSDGGRSASAGVIGVGLLIGANRHRITPPLRQRNRCADAEQHSPLACDQQAVYGSPGPLRWHARPGHSKIENKALRRTWPEGEYTGDDH
jgi:hypothetical protein